MKNYRPMFLIDVKLKLFKRKKAKIVQQMQQDCDGSWNKKNQWVSSGGKVVFK
ncbi:hypothetical protein SAMN05444360_12256 [Chryseobacterium carnipullorum]|nr:hypothetical protein SAMN05444360_12256 [Chryseobacterium carnipullorum]